jgi:transcriptional regulator with XRE-family HTH domain
MDETIGERIKRIAKERGKLSGAKLAEQFGVSYEALRRWSKGIDTPTPANAAAIAEYLGVPVSTVMFGAAPPPRRPDAEAIADAFDAMPVDSDSAIDRRQWLYASIMGQIAAQTASAPNPQPPQPDAPPTAARRPAAKTRP